MPIVLNLLRLTLLALSFWLAGCSSSNPQKDGFFAGVHGLQTGAYRARIDDKQDLLSTQEIRQQQLSKVASKSQTQIVTKVKTLGLRQQQLRSQQEKIKALQKHVEQRLKHRQALRQKRALAERKIARDKQLYQKQQAEKEKLQALISERMKLRKLLNELLSIEI